MKTKIKTAIKALREVAAAQHDQQNNPMKEKILEATNTLLCFLRDFDEILQKNKDLLEEK